MMAADTISDREQAELDAKYRRASMRWRNHQARHEKAGVTWCDTCSFHLNAVERARERAGQLY
jgi:hypothetical protein